MGFHFRRGRYEFECDGCDARLETDESVARDAAAEAYTHGWGTLTKRGRVTEWYCATCAVKVGAD